MRAVTEPAPLDSRRIGRGALLAAAGHVIVIIAAFLAGLIAKPSAGGGFEDLAAVSATFLAGEAVLGLVCLISGGLRFRREDRELGLGLVAGWIVGLIVLVIILKLVS